LRPEINPRAAGAFVDDGGGDGLGEIVFAGSAAAMMRAARPM